MVDIETSQLTFLCQLHQPLQLYQVRWCVCIKRCVVSCCENSAIWEQCNAILMYCFQLHMQNIEWAADIDRSTFTSLKHDLQSTMSCKWERIKKGRLDVQDRLSCSKHSLTFCVVFMSQYYCTHALSRKSIIKRAGACSFEARPHVVTAPPTVCLLPHHTLPALPALAAVKLCWIRRS